MKETENSTAIKTCLWQNLTPFHLSYPAGVVFFPQPYYCSIVCPLISFPESEKRKMQDVANVAA